MTWQDIAAGTRVDQIAWLLRTVPRDCLPAFMAARNSNGATALVTAAWSGRLEVVNALLHCCTLDVLLLSSNGRPSFNRVVVYSGCCPE